MRIVVSEFISLDGVVQAPGGPEEDTDGGFAHGGWSHPYFDPEVLGPAFTEGMERAEALLYGRRTYLTMAGAWPERAGDPFADRLNSLKKYIVTENQKVDVPVSREEVRVEREPITDANADDALSGPALSEEEHEVVLHEERPVVDKETVPVERVRLDRETVTDTETVDEDVRKERIDVEGDGRGTNV